MKARIVMPTHLAEEKIPATDGPKVEELRLAVEKHHGCHARLEEVVPVSESFEGGSSWNGIVHVFELDGHPNASRCYAWFSPAEGKHPRRFYGVLHQDPITSPVDAVRASVVSEFYSR